MTKDEVADKIIQLIGFRLDDVSDETRRLAEQVVEMEAKNPDRRSIEEWAESLSKYLAGPSIYK